MTPAIARLGAFWRQRSRREQAYLAAMAFSLALFGYWFLLVLPLRALAAEAELRHVTAVAEQARFPGVLAEVAQRRRVPAAPTDAASLVRSAASAGFVVSPDASAEPGRITLRFQAAPPRALFAWLAALRDGQGLQPLAASLHRGPSGLDGEVSFATAAP